MKAGRCSSCRERILWATSTTGKPMPLDGQPDALGSDVMLEIEDVRGLLFVVADVAHVVTKTTTIADVRGHALYRSHFASCPRAAAHRRR